MARIAEGMISQGEKNCKRKIEPSDKPVKQAPICIRAIDIFLLNITSP